MSTVLFGTFLAAEFSLQSGLSWAGIVTFTPRLTLIVQLASMSIAIGPLILWTLAVPYPVPLLGLSPSGLILDWGTRAVFVPWERAWVQGHRLEVPRRRLGGRIAYTLTPTQASRIGLLRPSTAY